MSEDIVWLDLLLFANKIASSNSDFTTKKNFLDQKATKEVGIKHCSQFPHCWFYLLFGFKFFFWKLEVSLAMLSDTIWAESCISDYWALIEYHGLDSFAS